MKICLFILGIFCFIFSGCQANVSPEDKAARERFEREYAKIANKTPIAVSNEPIRYGKPIVGIPHGAFINLCGKPSDVKTLDSTRGSTITYQYEFSESRKNNECWGIFTFIDNKLDSVYRN